MDIDFEEARRTVDQHLWLPLHVARNAAAKVRPGGTLLFTSGTGGRRPAVGMALSAAPTALPALTKALAVEIAPGSRQPHRTWLRRHTTVGEIARRSTRRTPRAAPRDVADRPRRRPRERRRARRPSHDEHRPHGRNLRYRRRAAAGGGLRAHRKEP